ncbi:LYRM7 factor, partial [Pseudoatta argentina]
MNRTSVFKWCREFKNGRTSVHDDQRSGRPDIVEKIENALRDDRRLTADELSAMFPQISRSLLHATITETLGYQKLSARWVPKQLTDQHKLNRVEAGQEFLRRYKLHGDEFLRSIVTGDETWPFYIRYVDNILFFFAAPANKIDEILELFNCLIYARLQFTMEIDGDDGVSFFDVKLLIEEAKIVFDVYKKPTDSKRNLSSVSIHNFIIRIKNKIIFILFFRWMNGYPLDFIFAIINNKIKNHIYKRSDHNNNENNNLIKKNISQFPIIVISQILRVFKKLHRTRLKTFEDDEYALQVVRDQINKEYKKHKNITNQAVIKELNKFAQEVECEIRTTVIQAVETAPGRVALRLTPDVLVDNVPYKDQKDDKLGKESKD